MKKQKKILVLVAFLFFINFSNIFAQCDNWIKIEYAFINLDSLNKADKKCHFEYKNIENSLIPDIDVFDESFTKIRDEISKENVVKLVDYYADYCEDLKNDEIQKSEFKNQIINFLRYDEYSIQLDYKSTEGRTVNLICLIYYENDQFILFWIEKNDN
ncbi:MAG TPA: hypothetical protein DEA97_12275 [Bacteroidales bacterium]|nr:MAG: hypothetical protein UR43_C0029G0006 [candidate division TM6 bacterium GW2011_GWF2_33_332]HBS87328.1 hypothetical protein [Bacteroidales bacterium]